MLKMTKRRILKEHKDIPKLARKIGMPQATLYNYWEDDKWPLRLVIKVQGACEWMKLAHLKDMLTERNYELIEEILQLNAWECE